MSKHDSDLAMHVRGKTPLGNERNCSNVERLTETHDGKFRIHTHDNYTWLLSEISEISLS